MGQEKWDKRYLRMAAMVALWSKDPRAQVGAVIVRRNRVIATGFNGFPEEVQDNNERLHNQYEKLELTVHAEENAMIVAGRLAEGATIYVHGKPVCSRCAGSIIQTGITRVVAEEPQKTGKSKWAKSGRLAKAMFSEKGLQCHHIALTKAELEVDDPNEVALASMLAKMTAKATAERRVVNTSVARPKRKTRAAPTARAKCARKSRRAHT